MHWIVAYDISADRGRGRVARHLERQGIRVQKSVFLVETSRRKMSRLLDVLSEYIDLQHDQIGGWPLQEAWRDNQFVVPPFAQPTTGPVIIA